jgi:hypothetical protein
MPLEQVNTAPEPAAVGSDMRPEALGLVHGRSTDDTYWWVHARGYVKASIRKTWDAMRTRDACVDRRSVSEWMVTENVEPQYKESFRVHCIVHDAITIDFDNVWRQDVAAGTAESPEVVIINWQKVEGSDVISLLRGSVLLTKLDDTTTQVEMIEHVQAFQGEWMPAESFLRDYFATTLALTKGQPLPTFP